MGASYNFQEWGLAATIGLYQRDFRDALIALSFRVGPFVAFIDLKARANLRKTVEEKLGVKP